MRVSVIMSVCSIPPAQHDAPPHHFLARALDSVLAARHPEGQSLQSDSPDVEILIGIDGDREKVYDAVVDWAKSRSAVFSLGDHDIPASWDGVRVRLWNEMPYRGQWGNPQRDEMLPHALGDLVHLTDQDDAYFPDALRGACAEADKYPGRPLIAKMRVHCHGALTCPVEPPDVLWKTSGRLEEGHVGGHMLIAPNRQDLLGRFEPHDLYSADFRYVSSTVEAFRAAGLPEVWVDGFLCMLRPWSAGL